MLLKIGTVEQLQKYKNYLPYIVYNEAFKIVETLDLVYGADRNVDSSAGGVVLIAETLEDVESIEKEYTRVSQGRHEYAEFLPDSNKKYVKSLHIQNNDFAIDIIYMDASIVPIIVLNDLEN